MPSRLGIRIVNNASLWSVMMKVLCVSGQCVFDGQRSEHQQATQHRVRLL